MLIYTLDVLFLLTLATTAYVASRSTMVQAGINFFTVLLASLFATTGFERFAKWISRNYLSATEEVIGFYLNFLSVLLLFGAGMAALIWLTHRILPNPQKQSLKKETAGRWGFGILTGYLLSAFLLTVLQTYPGPRDFSGSLPKNIEDRPGPIMFMAPDCQFLALTEYTCDHVFPLSGNWLLGRPINAVDKTGGHWESFLFRQRQLRVDVEEYYDNSDEDVD